MRMSALAMSPPKGLSARILLTVKGKRQANSLSILGKLVQLGHLSQLRGKTGGVVGFRWLRVVIGNDCCFLADRS